MGHTTQLSVQLVVATAGGNQLNAVLSGWEFPIGSSECLRQPVGHKVA